MARVASWSSPVIRTQTRHLEAAREDEAWRWPKAQPPAPGVRCGHPAQRSFRLGNREDDEQVDAMEGDAGQLAALPRPRPLLSSSDVLDVQARIISPDGVRCLSTLLAAQNML
jgi:hypothetical protein